jgi:hypothetical protein
VLLSSQSKFCLHKIADFKGHFDSPKTPAGISRGGGECELFFFQHNMEKKFCKGDKRFKTPIPIGVFYEKL